MRSQMFDASGCFVGYPLSQFVTHCADHFLTSEHKEVRLEAVKTCSHLLTPLLDVSTRILILARLRSSKYQRIVPLQCKSRKFCTDITV